MLRRSARQASGFRWTRPGGSWPCERCFATCVPCAWGTSRTTRSFRDWWDSCRRSLTIGPSSWSCCRRIKRRPAGAPELALTSRLDVFLEHLHAAPDAVLVLAPHQASRKAQQAAQLVVHLVDEVSAAVLRCVPVRPGPVERSAGEPACGQPGWVPRRVLQHQVDLKATGQVKFVADARSLVRLAGKGLGVPEVSRPAGRVGKVLVNRF